MESLLPGIIEDFSDAQASYSAAQPSRFRRQRNRLGGTADAHLATQFDYWKIRETVRDMVRNDAMIGQAGRRAVSNAFGSGLVPVPQTGDEGLDEEAKARWKDWSEDALQCDIARKFDFHQGCRMVALHSLFDGDIFAVPTGLGAIQYLEGELVNSPPNIYDDVVHGVELDSVGGAARYWLVKKRAGEHKRLGRRLYFDYNKRPALDPDGFPNVLHILAHDRVSQNRGISCLTPVLDLCGQFEDLNFAKVIQQQFASLIGAFITSDRDEQRGSRESQTQDDGTEIKVEQMKPGAMWRLQHGETVTPFAPNVTPPELFKHMRMLLRIIGASLGLPLFLVLLDSSDTVFHGYRGELEQAKLGFRDLQNMVIKRFARHVYRWKMREWFMVSPAGRRLEAQNRLYLHRWSRPGFPYVDPLVDAKADAMALENLLASPRDLAQRRGQNWEEVVAETVADRALSIRSAARAAAELNSEFEDLGVTWRDILNLKPQTGVSISEARETGPAPAGAAA